MSRSRNALEHNILAALSELESQDVIRGLGTDARRTSLAKQIVESYRRILFVRKTLERDVSPSRVDPKSELFDPLKAAIFLKRNGETDECFWMVFLFVHFGKNLKGGWRYAREVYGALGQRQPWSWKNIRSDPSGFRRWLHANQATISRKDPPGGFGNHRKYTSLNALKENGTGAAFESYVGWVGDSMGHSERFDEITEECSDTPDGRFGGLYESMKAVKSFGRMAIFDYLCMIGKLELYDVEPGAVYIADATGPKAGGKMLFGGSPDSAKSNSELEDAYAKLAAAIKLPFVMQILEDAVCNWQKSPDEFKAFRG